MGKSGAYVEQILQHLGINYERRGWLYLCDLEGRPFYYSPQKGKWRIKGKKIWHSSRSVRDFLAQARAYSPPSKRASQSQERQQNSPRKSPKKHQNSHQKSQGKGEQSGASGQKQGAEPFSQIRAFFLDFFGYYLQQQRKNGYKLSWIWYTLIEQYLPTPQEICWLCVVFGYSKVWAVYKIQELYAQANREQIFAVIEKNRDEWLRYFQNRWGIQSDRQESRERQTSRKEESPGYALSYRGYLEVLRLSFPFTPQELKSAYRRRAMETHPDNGGTAEAFREVHAAYQVLCLMKRES